ncbi:hypothetical protein [Candidatus Accumulibacter sp. ACC003]|uniref:hypothetical protein n=1 Tax=Candidatus Accumulibacter sp. ACC003 TaxID=2823334 RepID=UPI0025BC484D|nr:hypothetical protein [Candidatus Accumulibacter sp. ACC003]
MNPSAKLAAHAYFPAIVCAEHDSPIDALVGLCVPRDEAMNLVTASWTDGAANCLMAIVAGGRTVVVLRTPERRWAACNAFCADLHATPQEAYRRLLQLLKRHRQGYVACLPAGSQDQCSDRHNAWSENLADGGAVQAAG